MIRRHRKGFRLYWRGISQPGPGRPPISGEVQALIRRLARENGWRARKIQAELENLGFTVSLATVSRYLPKRRPDEQERQRWTCRFSISIRSGIAEFFSPCAEILRRPDAGIEPATKSRKRLESLMISNSTLWRPCGAHHLRPKVCGSPDSIPIWNTVRSRIIKRENPESVDPGSSLCSVLLGMVSVCQRGFVCGSIST